MRRSEPPSSVPGFMGKKYTQTIRRLGHVNIVAVAAVDAATSALKIHQVERTTGDFMRAVGKPNIKNRSSNALTVTFRFQGCSRSRQGGSVREAAQSERRRSAGNG